MGDDAGRIPPRHRGQRGRCFPDDACGAANAAGTALGRIINVTTSLDTMWRSLMQPYGGSKAANEALLTALSMELEGTGVTANVLVPGGAANTRMVPTRAASDRSALIAPEVMVPPLLWLCSNDSDGVSGQRFIACAGIPSCCRPKPPKLPARQWHGSSSAANRSCRIKRARSLIILGLSNARLFAEFPFKLRGFGHQFDAKLLQSARQFVAPTIPCYPGASFGDSAQILGDGFDHQNRCLFGMLR